MFRQSLCRTAQNASRLAGRRFQSTANVPVLANFEQWVTLSEVEQQKISTQLAEVMKNDWNAVSTENKKAAYYVAYGLHGVREPREKPGDTQKIILGTLGLIAISLSVSTYLRTKGEVPRTMNKEWQQASNEYAKENNMNPIHGISSEGYSGKGFVQ
ncbi:cytochrome c oxidase [Mycoemilia scoparia]|uniref:Cytochrome c oxidase n=1 Tax=Mycoemilia scoparia TaxID=417184 RepID=A0A9W8A663_9FUNG|nr:cytochrome c oxidase [Mycoemilia scoparia]